MKSLINLLRVRMSWSARPYIGMSSSYIWVSRSVTRFMSIEYSFTISSLKSFMRLSINCRLWGWDFCLASYLPSSVVINNSNFLYSFSWIIISWCCNSCYDFYLSCLFLGFSTLFFCDLYGYLILNSIAAISFTELSISLKSCLNSRKWPCKQDCSISTLRSWVMH